MTDSADWQYFSEHLNSAQLGRARRSESADFSQKPGANPPCRLRRRLAFPHAGGGQTRRLLLPRCVTPAQTGGVKPSGAFLPPPLETTLRLLGAAVALQGLRT